MVHKKSTFAKHIKMEGSMSLYSMFSLLADSASQHTTTGTGDASAWGDWAWLKGIADFIDSLIVPIMILVGTAGLIYSIVLGVNLARADGAEKVKEAKQRLVNAIVGLVSIIVLMLLLWLFIANVPAIFGENGIQINNYGSNTESGGGGSVIQAVISML